MNSTMKGMKWILGISLIVASLSVRSKAEDTPSPAATGVSLGVRAMYFDPKDADDSNWSGGVQLRIRPWNLIGFEGSVDYRREDFGDTKVHIWPVQASLLAYVVPMHPATIFLLGGAGWYYTSVDNPGSANDDTDNRFGLHAGAGVEVSLNEAWSLDGTYRYVWLEDLSTTDQTLLKKDFSGDGHMVTIGLNYHF